MVVDFNICVASVEQQEQPALRGWPVAVVPMMADTTCAIAASYEAKRFGVKTGTLVCEAKRMHASRVLHPGGGFAVLNAQSPHPRARHSRLRRRRGCSG